MFSRFSRLAICDVQKCIVTKYQQSCGISTSKAVYSNVPTESGQRDLVNFPKRIRPETAPPVRLLMIPESWFQFLYPKTGVTGPYVLFGAVATALLSKEIVVTHGIPHVISFCIVVSIFNYKLGPLIADFYNKGFEARRDEIDANQNQEINDIKGRIAHIDAESFSMDVIDEVTKAKKENIQLQMEGQYRERLVEVYNKVKKQLDFQVEMENNERRIAQKNLSDYVIRNVLSSITPEIEKNVMQMCIKNLSNIGK